MLRCRGVVSVDPMPFHLYKARKEGAEAQWFGIRVEFDEDRWVATCREADAEGEARGGPDAIAPPVYGVTAELAHRRMLSALENTYDTVVRAR